MTRRTFLSALGALPGLLLLFPRKAGASEVGPSLAEAKPAGSTGIPYDLNGSNDCPPVKRRLEWSDKFPRWPEVSRWETDKGTVVATECSDGQNYFMGFAKEIDADAALKRAHAAFSMTEYRLAIERAFPDLPKL